MLLKKETIRSVLKRTLSAFLIVVFIFFPLQKTEAAAQWVNLEINPTYVDGDLTDFPVYVDLSDLPTAFWTTTNCTDIRVFKSDGTTEVPREIVSCTDSGSSGTGELWFLADGTLSSTATTTFQIHYDGTSSDYAVTATYGRNNVWTAYRGVWHMNEDPSGSAPQLIDSTGNGNSGTSAGSMTSGDLITSPIGNAINFDGSNDVISVGTDTSLDTPAEGSITAYVRPETDVRSSNWIFANTNGPNIQFGLEFGRSGTKYDLIIGGSSGYDILYSTNNVTLNSWQHLATTIDASGNVNLYKNGVGESGNPQSSTRTRYAFVEAYMGNIYPAGSSQWFDGDMDEVRLALGELSSDWIAAEYDNQNTPTPFYWVSGEQTAGGGGAVIRQSIFWF